MFPVLFITIACGACSGFHALIASGTTSKQLRRETDAKVVGYGSMLLEGMVAVVSLCCVMMLAANAPVVALGARFAHRIPLRLARYAAAGLFALLALAIVLQPAR